MTTSGKTASREPEKEREKAVRHLLCAAPFGPFRQKVAVPFFPSARLVGIAIVSLAIFCGCGINRRYANDMIHRLPHSDIDIEYTVSGSAVQVSGGESGEDGTPTPEASSKQILSVTYPHSNPELGRAYALITLRERASGPDSSAEVIARRLATNPFLEQAVRAAGAELAADSPPQQMNLKREELEFLLRDLVADGFFDRGQRDGHVQLSVALGRRSLEKQWDHVAVLDELATRVRQQPGAEPAAVPQVPRNGPPAAQLLAPAPVDDRDLSPDANRVELVPDPGQF